MQVPIWKAFKIPESGIWNPQSDSFTSSEASLPIASVSSDRSAQKDSQFEGTGARTVASEDVRQLGSNPVVPT